MPIATRRGRGSHVGQVRDLHAAEAYDGLAARPSVASAPRRRSARPRRRAGRRPARPRRAARPPGRGRRRARSRRPASPTAGRGPAPRRASRCRSPASRPAAPASSTRNGPIARAAQLLAVGVAEVGDQRADVGARRALDDERRRGRPRASAARSGDTATSRSGISTSSPRARHLVGALAADLDRAVRGRALEDRARRQRQRGRPASRPVSVISPSGSPVVDVQPKRATVS